MLGFSYRVVKGMTAAASLAVAAMYCNAVYAHPTQTVEYAQWSHLSIPAEPGSDGTVEALLGDDLPPEQYGLSGNWLIYSFDSVAYQYRFVELNEPLRANTGYWLFQTVAESVELDIPENLPAVSGDASAGCIQGSRCASVPLTGNGSTGVWNMVGYSSDSNNTFGDTRFITASGPCVSGCTPAQARAANIVMDIMYTLNDAGTAYDLITESSAMQAWDGYWLLVLPDADQLRWIIPVADDEDPPTVPSDTTLRAEENADGFCLVDGDIERDHPGFT
ncbi:MAG: hypothetical protein AB8B63_01985, partial [Granulosicoccus sp.]